MLAHTIRHLYRYVGDIPCTGPFQCAKCGKVLPDGHRTPGYLLEPCLGSASKRIYAESHGKDGAL